MTFYKNFIKSNRWGYPLKGGPFTKWRYPLARVLYKKRLEAGPEPIRHRSVWSNWNYDSEIYAFGKRLNENFNETILKQAFIHPSYVKLEIDKLKELGLEESQTVMSDNSKLVEEGELLCKNYVIAILKFWYPRLPQEAIEQIQNYVLSTAQLSYIAQNIGLVDLIKSEDFPVLDETKKKSLYAVIGALKQSSGVISAQLFINDFIITQLIGKNLNEIWTVKNPMAILVDELKKDGVDISKLVPRILWTTGVSQPNPVYIVGLYIGDKQFSIGYGESLDIAEEMSARDGLRRVYGTTDDAAPLPYGDKARKYSETINYLYEKVQKI